MRPPVYPYVLDSQQRAVVPIVPSRTWSQAAMQASTPSSPTSPKYPQPSLLGLSMRLCQPELSLDNVWHVLDVLEGSPAESAGLVPYGDWIVGWSEGTLTSEGDFYDLVEAVSVSRIPSSCLMQAGIAC